MYTAYIIQSTLTGMYYRGFTELTAEGRLAYHNKGTVSATKDQRPWKLVWYEVFESRESKNTESMPEQSEAAHGVNPHELTEVNLVDQIDLREKCDLVKIMRSGDEKLGHLLCT
jgi:putative endonuclease